MSEVQVRLSELRSAAEQIYQSSLRMQISLDLILPLIDQSLLDALSSSENALLYHHQRANISASPNRVRDFADKLTSAADDIEVALGEDNKGQSGIVHFYAPRKRTSTGASIIMGLMAGTNNGTSSPEPTFLNYVSRRNQSLMDELTLKQSKLSDNQASLALLITGRNELQQDLAALKNRMISFDGTSPIENHPRVLLLNQQLSDFDTQISHAQTDISNLEIDVKQLTERINRVKPLAGADINAIIALEGAQNPQWMQTSTFGCVNHIVNKMPLPNGIPRDALLWDEAALQHPEYGISWGSTPLEGSVLQLDPAHPYADDTLGHVLYVERVEHGVVWVTDNLHPTEPVRLTDITNKIAGEDMRYLYFPWNTKA